MPTLSSPAPSDDAVSPARPSVRRALLANGALLAVFRDLSPVQYSQVAAIAVAPLLGLLMLQVQAPPVRPVGRWMYAFYPLHLLGLSSLAIAWS